MKAIFTLCSCLLLGFSVSHAQVELTRSLDDNGKLSAIWFQMGPEEVQVIRFYANGQLQEVGNWYQGRMHGSWAMWAENGHKVGEAHYSMGRKTGCWKLWSPEGEWQYDLLYDQDQLVDAQIPAR
ncbi:MAG: hypothetical protein GC205_08155 [Bacteroidetes bacterium]|nr:hypothetical protein [Bacteroidota bacterium]